MPRGSTKSVGSHPTTGCPHRDRLRLLAVWQRWRSADMAPRAPRGVPGAAHVQRGPAPAPWALGRLRAGPVPCAGPGALEAAPLLLGWPGSPKPAPSRAPHLARPLPGARSRAEARGRWGGAEPGADGGVSSRRAEQGLGIPAPGRAGCEADSGRQPVGSRPGRARWRPGLGRALAALPTSRAWAAVSVPGPCQPPGALGKSRVFHGGCLHGRALGAATSSQGTQL